MKSQLGTDAKGSPAFPDGQVSESDAQALRALAEEISYPAAPRLEETALVLYDRDPGYIQAQWYVTLQALAEARRLFPGGGSGLRQVLRLCRLDRDGCAEVVASTPQGSDVSEGAGEDGFALPGDGAEYSCELGLESDAGGWLLLARSNRVRLGDRPLSPSRTAPVTDNPGARNGSLATAEQPEEVEGMPVEAALAAVGGPLHPVFPNLDLDDAPIAGGHPVPVEEAPEQARLRNRKPEYPPGVPPYVVSYRESDDAPPGHSVPLAEAPGQEGPEQGIPDQAGSGDRRSGFSPGISHDLPFHLEEGVAKGTDLRPLTPSRPLTPTPSPQPLSRSQPLSRWERGLCDILLEAGAGIPSDLPVEAALAAVGEPLHPVFPNLDLDEVPSPGYSESLEEIPGRAWVQDRGLEFPSGIPRDLVSYPETATDLPPGAELVDMPPPLLPSSPELNTATADNMPGPIYDPRAALSSAVLSGGALPSMPDLELHAELIVHGRAAAGSSTVDLFGHPIAVGADGRFYIRRPIDISALEPLAAGGGLPAWLEAAGHG